MELVENAMVPQIIHFSTLNYCYYGYLSIFYNPY